MTDHISLLQQYLRGEISPKTNVELANLFMEYPELQNLLHDLRTPESLGEILEDYNTLYGKKGVENENRNLSNLLHTIRLSKIVWYRKPFLKYIAAAIVLFCCGLILWIYTSQDTVINSQLITNGNVIAPATNKAILTLEDGTHVNLSAEHNGIIISDEITYENGVAIHTPKDASRVLALTTPRGGQYHVTLSDGTKVWMNAESKISYPSVFAADSRQVYVEGEAYFEVAKDNVKPFIVTTATERVKVLGTHFNVNAYENDPYSTISLVEGSVEVESMKSGLSKKLVPNQQSVNSDRSFSVQNFEVAECLSWKNGEFMFSSESLSNVAKILERWYDVDIDVDNSLADIKIWGSVSRFEDFDAVMDVIKRVDNRINYVKKEGRKIIMN